MKRDELSTIVIVLTVFFCAFLTAYNTNKRTAQSKATHNRMHNLIIDSIQMHDYFERNYECDNYYPCPVSVECDLNE